MREQVIVMSVMSVMRDSEREMSVMRDSEREMSVMRDSEREMSAREKVRVCVREGQCV